MDNFTNKEALSSSDRDLLIKDMGSLKFAYEYGRFILPLLLILTSISWYFDWYGIIKFLTTSFTVILMIVVIVSFIQIRNIKSDLKENVKHTVRFVLMERFIMGDVPGNSMNNSGINALPVRRRLKIDDARILEAIAHKNLSKENDTPFSNLLRDSSFDALLAHTYSFNVSTIGGKTTETFIVPIEYYLVGTEGKVISIAYALHSRKVFSIES